MMQKEKKNKKSKLLLEQSFTLFKIVQILIIFNKTFFLKLTNYDPNK